MDHLHDVAESLGKGWKWVNQDLRIDGQKMTEGRRNVTSSGRTCSSKHVKMNKNGVKKRDEQRDLGAIYVDKPIQN